MDTKKLDLKLIALITAAAIILLLGATILIASLFPQTRFKVVKFLNKNRNIREKITAYEKFADKNKKFLPAKIAAARTNMQWGFFSPENSEFIDSAMKQYKSILKIDPKNTEAISDLGLISAFKKDFDKAEEYYMELVKLDPKNSSYRLNLARLYFQTDRLNKALEKTKEAISLDPNNYDSYILESAIYEKMGDLSSAIYDCKKAVTGYTEKKDKSKEVYARHQLGRLYIQAGLNINALQEFEKIIKINPAFQE